MKFDPEKLWIITMYNSRSLTYLFSFFTYLNIFLSLRTLAVCDRVLVIRGLYPLWFVVRERSLTLPRSCLLDCHLATYLDHGPVYFSLVHSCSFAVFYVVVSFCRGMTTICIHKILTPLRSFLIWIQQSIILVFPSIYYCKCSSLRLVFGKLFHRVYHLIGSMYSDI